MRFSCFAQKSSEGPEEGVEHLLWNGQSIAFTIRRGSPRRKRTLIRVTRAGKVEVILPPFLLRKEAFAAIQSRGGWILDRLREIQSCPQPSPLFPLCLPFTCSFICLFTHVFIHQALKSLVYVRPWGSRMNRSVVLPCWKQKSNESCSNTPNSIISA